MRIRIRTPIGKCSDPGHCFKVSLLYKNYSGEEKKIFHYENFADFLYDPNPECSHPRIWIKILILSKHICGSGSSPGFKMTGFAVIRRTDVYLVRSRRWWSYYWGCRPWSRPLWWSRRSWQSSSVPQCPSPPPGGPEILCASMPVAKCTFVLYRYWQRYAVLRIHDILVWIRIRGSMPLNNGSGSGSCYSSLTFKTQTKNRFFFKFFCLLRFEGRYIYIIFQR